ncbi:PRA1 family protein B4 [Ananas comosus]|uniref:PRA1 family protein n=1 Tax=Ananas comosus TaxID=4615 RepID=A0A199W923_ANACO|nr:PRA1 family protein B4 [Ananas comosus]
MASSSPPILPTTAAASAGSGAAASSAASLSALRLFLGRAGEAARRALAHRRPWAELLDRSAFARPDSLSDAASRLRRNLAYFRVNYLALLGLSLASSLLAHPFSLLVLLLLASAWSFLYVFRPADAPPLVLLGRPFSHRETLAALSLLTLLVVFLTSVGSLIVYALMLGGALVCAHGAFRVPEDLFLDDQDPAAAPAGLLSFLGGAAAATSAAASAGTAIRV